MKLDLLVIAVHPDDAELGAGGVLAKYAEQGKKTGIVDLTRGELGSRGTAETRMAESQEAAKILNLSVRENLGFRDGFFKNDEEHQLKLIQTIRKYQPEIVITNAYEDRHPDHGRASALVNDALFLSGLIRIETHDEQGNPQDPFRPQLQLQFIQDRFIQPDILIDITPYWNTKEKSVLAYKTQFDSHTEEDGPQTYISNPVFMEATKARALELGRSIQVRYAEGFTCRRTLGVKNLFDLV